MKGMLMSLGMFGCCMAVTLLAFEITSAVLFSQIELPPLEGASSLTSVGFAIWYGWYVTTRAIPKIVDQHSAQVDKIEAAHERQINSLAATFRDEMRTAREHFQCERRDQE
jgi:hypothetical protein